MNLQIQKEKVCLVLIGSFCRIVSGFSLLSLVRGRVCVIAALAFQQLRAPEGYHPPPPTPPPAGARWLFLIRPSGCEQG